MEILDRVVGKNIYDATPSDILNAYQGFAASGKARSKIMMLLNKHLVSNLFHYNAYEILSILDMHLHSKIIDHQIFELVEPYLQNKLSTLTSDCLIQVIKIFSHQGLEKRYAVLEDAESYLLTNVEQLSG